MLKLKDTDSTKFIMEYIALILNVNLPFYFKHAAIEINNSINKSEAIIPESAEGKYFFSKLNMNQTLQFLQIKNVKKINVIENLMIIITLLEINNSQDPQTSHKDIKDMLIIIIIIITVEKLTIITRALTKNLTKNNLITNNNNHHNNNSVLLKLIS